MTTAPASSIVERLRGGPPLVLDGGLGTLLERRGHDVSGMLWSTRLLLDEPEAVRSAHREFFEAGADVAITDSYQASNAGLVAVGRDRTALADLIRQSVRVAREGADSVEGERFVAASIGPYGATLADGSEFHGQYGLSVAELTTWHRGRFAAYEDSGADILAIETIPSAAEVEAVAAALSGTGMAAWVALTAALGASRSGDPFEESYRILDEVPEVVAVGINCSHPSEVSGAIAAARRVTAKPIVVYPNSGEEWDAKNHRWVHHTTFTPELVRHWRSEGVTAIGGCCRVDPDQIRFVAEQLRTESGLS